MFVGGMVTGALMRVRGAHLAIMKTSTSNTRPFKGALGRHGPTLDFPQGIYIFIHLSIYMYVYIYIRMYICDHMCIYNHLYCIYIHTLHYITLQYSTVHYITLHTYLHILHYIILHYITYIHIDIDISNKYAPSGAQPDQIGSQGARSIVPAALVTWCHVSRCNLRLWINSYKYHVYAMFIWFYIHRHSVLHVGIQWYPSMVWASLISSIHPRTGNGLYWCIILLLAVGDWLIQLHGGNPAWDMLWDSLE